MEKTQNKHTFDLEERTLNFNKKLLASVSKLKSNSINDFYISQVVRSGGSIGANYREANETYTKKEFIYRIRICAKESKETVYWIDLILEANGVIESFLCLKEEAFEFLKIFSSIHKRSSKI